MISKMLEIRDHATFIPVLAIQLGSDAEGDRYLLSRSGYGPTRTTQEEYIVLARIDGDSGQCHWCPLDWGDRTMTTAHRWIIDHFGELAPGAVVDVRHILGETAAPAKSEAEIGF